MALENNTSVNTPLSVLYRFFFLNRLYEDAILFGTLVTSKLTEELHDRWIVSNQKPHFDSHLLGTNHIYL